MKVGAFLVPCLDVFGIIRVSGPIWSNLRDELFVNNGLWMIYVNILWFGEWNSTTGCFLK